MLIDFGGGRLTGVDVYVDRVLSTFCVRTPPPPNKKKKKNIYIYT